MQQITASMTVGGVVYTLPKVTTEQYLNYLDVRDPIAKKELYSRADFYAMADALVELYGNKFTREELLGPDGVTPGEVIVQFSMIESVLMGQVDGAIEAVKENFTTGTQSTTN